MNYLFAYGSLLSVKSASRTLLRQVKSSDISLARAQGYKRTWTAPADVVINKDGSVEVRKALFLDLSCDIGASCNGALIKIFDGEWEHLDEREKSYTRIKIQVEVNAAFVSAFTYMVPPERKSSEGVILANYVEIINKALKVYPETFVREFWEGTEDVPRNLVSGHYNFLDPGQDRAAGRYGK